MRDQILIAAIHRACDGGGQCSSIELNRALSKLCDNEMFHSFFDILQANMHDFLSRIECVGLISLSQKANKIFEGRVIELVYDNNQIAEALRASSGGIWKDYIAAPQ